MLNNETHMFTNVCVNDSHASTRIGRKDVLGDISVSVYNMADYSPPAILTAALYGMFHKYMYVPVVNKLIMFVSLYDILVNNTKIIIILIIIIIIISICTPSKTSK